MARKIWVHGPISLDSIVHVDRVPLAGGFVRSTASEKRVGGSGANIAFGLATTGIPTCFITWVGSDELASTLKQRISESLLTASVVKEFDGLSGEVAVLIDRDGERTIIGLSPSRLEDLHIDGATLEPGDIVVFTLWRHSFLPDLIKAQGLGCTVIVGAQALDDPTIPSADLVIGSIHDYSGKSLSGLGAKFPRIVLSNGAAGADEYNGTEQIHVGAVTATSIDATGAGDAFIAGYIASYFHGLPSARSLEIGALWGAAAVETRASIPPHFDEIRRRGAIEF